MTIPTYDDLPEDRRAVFQSWYNQDVAYVVVEFDGSGDEGMLQDKHFHGCLGEPVTVNNPDALDDYLYDVATNDYDWVNNDGGCGQCYLLVRPYDEIHEWKPIHLDVAGCLEGVEPGHGFTEYNIRYVETNTYTGSF